MNSETPYQDLEDDIMESDNDVGSYLGLEDGIVGDIKSDIDEVLSDEELEDEVEDAVG